MNSKLSALKRYAILVAVLFVFASITNIYPQDAEKTDGAKEVKKLPPINYVRSRDFDMRHIALDLKFDWEKEQTFGTATITLAPLVTNLKTVDLDAGLMIFYSVKSNGKDLAFEYKEPETRLRITLDREYKIGEAITFTVDYRTKGETVPNTLAFGGGGGLKFVKPTKEEPTKRWQIWSQGETDYNRYWFPSYDSPNDFATTELTATVKKPLIVISNGKLLETKDNADNTQTFHWKMDTPHANYLTSIVVGEYAEVKGEYAGIPVSTYVFPNELKEGKFSGKNLPAMVKFFSEKTGVKYPYVKYAQTVATDFNGGMENISATTMTPGLIFDERTALDTDSESLQAHELAHQWFGDYVTTREWAHIWLNESFATYMQALYTESSKGHDEFLYSDILNDQQAYLSAWKQGNRRPIVTRYYASKDGLFDSYAYPRGSAVLHMLHKHLGDVNWWRSINHYLTKYANQPVETEQLRIAIEETTGQSMDWFFDQWLYKMGHPIFEVTKKYNADRKQLTLNIKQTQKVDPLNEYPQVEFFQTYVDIQIDDRIEKVWLEAKEENVFTFAVNGEPKLVDFDNEGTLIKELKFEKSVDELVYQAKNDSDILGRNWAIQELAKSAKSKETNEAVKGKNLDTFRNIAVSDKAWILRREALNKIGATLLPPNSFGTRKEAVSLDEATIQTLLKAAKDEHSQVRGNAISLLAVTKDAKFADLYQNALNDQSYFVIDQAAIALANTKSKNAYTSLLKLTETDSWRNRIKIAGLNGLAALEEKRAFALGFKLANDKTQDSSVRISALGIVAATGKDDPRAFPLIFEGFKKSLETSDFNGIFNGFQTLIKLGDPRGQEAFDMAKEKFKENQNLLGFIDQLESQFTKALEEK